MFSVNNQFTQIVVLYFYIEVYRQFTGVGNDDKITIDTCAGKCQHSQERRDGGWIGGHQGMKNWRKECERMDQWQGDWGSFPHL